MSGAGGVNHITAERETDLEADREPEHGCDVDCNPSGEPVREHDDALLTSWIELNSCLCAGHANTLRSRVL